MGGITDVNASANDGCEKVDSPLDTHTQNKASYVGAFSCNDNSSQQNITGTIVSDARVHESNAIDGFDVNSGSAPDWHKIKANGGLCVNDIDLDLQMNSSQFPTCYQFTVITSTYPNGITCQTNGSGKCGFDKSTGEYKDDTDIFLEVEKICSTNMSESVGYTITGHL